MDNQVVMLTWHQFTNNLQKVRKGGVYRLPLAPLLLAVSRDCMWILFRNVAGIIDIEFYSFAFYIYYLIKNLLEKY